MVERTQALPRDSHLDTDELLYGNDPLAGIVAVEPAAGEAVRLYRRVGGEIFTEDAPFRPWLLAEHADLWQSLRIQPRIEQLSGEHALRYVVEFPTWSALLDAVQHAESFGATFFRLRSPIEQYLVRSGRTLFKGMVFSDPRRLQIDIETIGLDPHDPHSQLIVVALRCNDQDEVLTLEGEEAALLAQLNGRILELDPDIIEGHNLFNFDLPFLVGRAERLGIALRWGRDGSPIRIGASAR